MAQIFLCYAREDKPQVEDIYRRLYGLGFQPWMDRINLLPGQKWREETLRELKTSDFIIVFLSCHSVSKRGHVQREIQHTIDTLDEMPEGMIHTIPVRLDNCRVPTQFRDLHWCDLFEEDGFDKIVQSIRAGLTQRQQAGPSVQQMESVETANTVPSRQQPDASSQQDDGERQVFQKERETPERYETVENERQSLAQQCSKWLVIWRAKIVESIATAWGRYSCLLTWRVWFSLVAFFALFGSFFVYKPVRDLLFGTGVTTLSSQPPVVVQLPQPETKSISGGSPVLPPPPRLSDTLGMKFIYISPEKFSMGSTKGDNNEKAVHEVSISKPFCLGAYKVTQRQWQQVMGKNSSIPQNNLDDPVNNISWENIQEFLQKLKERDPGVIYRLPTEAEWEYAARTTILATPNLQDAQSNVPSSLQCGPTEPSEPQPTGSQQSNTLELYGMQGKGWEWVQDYYRPFYPLYPQGRVNDPLGPSAGAYRVLRGGGWHTHALYSRVTKRSFDKPDIASEYYGFRVVREK